MSKQFTHAVVCLDDDERTTVIARATSEARAETKLNELSKWFPNAEFDIYETIDVEAYGIQNTYNEWHKEASPVWKAQKGI